jgi:hypothetical protein
MFKDDNLQELLNKYRKYVNEREVRRLNFNRKDRWQQSELDDIMKNFDIKTAKFKDFSKLAIDANILNKKEFNNVEEIYYYLEQLFKEGFLEEHISSALDVFLKDIKFFKEEDLKTDSFKLFLRELSTNMISFTSDSTIYKTAKFLDWYNIKDPYCWYNLERIITNKGDTMKPDIAIKTLAHFANQNQGTGEFYDMFQYQFWSDCYEKVSNSDYISLGYSLFITTQGIILIK